MLPPFSTIWIEAGDLASGEISNLSARTKFSSLVALVDALGASEQLA